MYTLVWEPALGEEWPIASVASCVRGGLLRCFCALLRALLLPRTPSARAMTRFKRPQPRGCPHYAPYAAVKDGSNHKENSLCSSAVLSPFPPLLALASRARDFLARSRSEMDVQNDSLVPRLLVMTTSHPRTQPTHTIHREDRHRRRRRCVSWARRRALRVAP